MTGWHYYAHFTTGIRELMACYWVELDLGFQSIKPGSSYYRDITLVHSSVCGGDLILGREE